MTDERELNTWIAGHVMKWKRETNCLKMEPGLFFVHPTEGVMIQRDSNYHLMTPFRPTTNPADALAVLKKCAEKTVWGIEIGKLKDGQWFVGLINVDGNEIAAYGPTLESAIAQFARQLFNPTKE